MSSPEKRLTLSQVYDWMVQNIPYFKDKGDSNSSAGWKVGDLKTFNSIPIKDAQYNPTYMYDTHSEELSQSSTGKNWTTDSGSPGACHFHERMKF